jgi:hypothetical protein
MDQSDSQSRSRVRIACARLICELGIERNRECPYFLPYSNYVMSWCDHIPINTIIIGQNPYPTDVYPEYGSAFAYDQKKSPYQKSVDVLAKDIHNYDSTDANVSTECFRDSWKLLDIGVILINETVYDKIYGGKENTRAIKEMGAQCRALEVVIAESYFLGQSTLSCIGMGIPAACMTSIIRSWYPKDLFEMRIITCRNPAARDIGDMPSREITLGKTAVSKILSSIVESYTRMPSKSSAQEKRRQQNAKSLKDSANEVTVNADQYESELQSFEDRLRGLRNNDNNNSSVEEIMNSSGGLRKATNKFKNSILTYNVTMMMVMEGVEKTYQSQDPGKTPDLSLTRQTSTPVSVRVGNGRRRVVRATREADQIETVPEVAEPPVEQQNTILSPAPSQAPSRGRRRVATRTPSYAPSVAETEYTTASIDAPLDTTETGGMSDPESIVMGVFGNWCNDNNIDSVCQELIYNASEEKMVSSPLTTAILSYIRLRKNEDSNYDAFAELVKPESRSFVWAKENIPYPS